MNGEAPVLPGKQVENSSFPKKEKNQEALVESVPERGMSESQESFPEVQPEKSQKPEEEQEPVGGKEPEELQKPEKPDVSVVGQGNNKNEVSEIPKIETLGAEIGHTADNVSLLFPKILKWGLPVVFLIGIIFFVFQSLEQKQKEEEAEAKAMEIEARYNEYLQYLHAGDSLVDLGNNSQGGDYEQFYLGAVGRYDAALRMNIGPSFLMWQTFQYGKTVCRKKLKRFITYSYLWRQRRNKPRTTIWRKFFINGHPALNRNRPY